jgi:hypothetical protein
VGQRYTLKRKLHRIIHIQDKENKQLLVLQNISKAVTHSVSSLLTLQQAAYWQADAAHFKAERAECGNCRDNLMAYQSYPSLRMPLTIKPHQRHLAGRRDA